MTIDKSKYKIVGGMYISASDPGSWLLREGMRDGYPMYQYDRLETAVALCKQRRRAIDGGAHVGTWSAFLRNEFDRVSAFEPVRENAECFYLNLFGKSNVQLHQAALGNINGPIYMRNDGGKSVSWKSSFIEAGERAECVRLDDLGFDDVDLIKLDVEGFEHEALLGAKETIIECKPVIVIEEKHDPEEKASKLLIDFGMVLIHQMKHDRIFAWEK